MEEERKILEEYIKEAKLKNTPQRYIVLEVFLSLEKHLSVDELYEYVIKKYPRIGHSTVFRTMKIIETAGLATSLPDKDGIIKYEHSYKHQHHDHLVCEKCGKMIEFENKSIEKIQQKIAKKYNFNLKKHSLKLIGLCKDCNQ